MEYDRDGDYIVDLDSDNENVAESSEDEIDIILHGSLKDKRHLRRRSLGQASSSSEDEFEKEMNAELDNTVKDLQKKNQFSGQTSLGGNNASSEEKFYDNDYFDSDSDDEGTSAEKKQRKHPVLSNDDLLYDPNMDDEDQRWVDAQRQSYQPRGRGGAGRHGRGERSRHAGKKSSQSVGSARPLPQSDAVLNCPSCMTTLCMDCQRHDVYKNQYRAMFVSNCTVDSTERLRFPKLPGRNNRKRKHKKDSAEQTLTQHPNLSGENKTGHQVSLSTKGEATDQTGMIGQGDATNYAGSASEQGEEQDLFNPVRCSECKTEVGVFDSDEVFHFYNVLASYA